MAREAKKVKTKAKIKNTILGITSEITIIIATRLINIVE